MIIKNDGSGFGDLWEDAWYLIQCKPRQDARAEEHLIRQGYQCSRPVCVREKTIKGKLQWLTESLFPGYLFINLPKEANWVPLRSTRGVRKVVCFGGRPLPVSHAVIAELQCRSKQSFSSVFGGDDRASDVDEYRIHLDAIFSSSNCDERTRLLLDLVSRQRAQKNRQKVKNI